MVAAVSSDVLAKRVWSGEIQPGPYRGQVVLGAQELTSWLAELGAELSSLAAGVFCHPVMLHLTAGPQDLTGQTALIREQLAWVRRRIY